MTEPFSSIRDTLLRGLGCTSGGDVEAVGGGGGGGGRDTLDTLSRAVLLSVCFESGDADR